MNHIALMAAAAIAAGAPTTSASAAAPPALEAAVRAVEQRQAAAWNAHDAGAYAALFTADGDVVNVLGWHWRGRGEIAAKLTRAFALVFAKSRMDIGDVTVRAIAPGLAVAHVRWTMSGALVPTGGAPAPTEGIQTQLLQRQGGAWKIAALQNTNAIPERPFPLP